MTAFDRDEVQGDIVVGLLKQVECFVFIRIADRGQFLQALAENARRLITSTAKAQQQRQEASDFKKSNDGALLKMTAVNIAFSAKGLETLHVNQQGLDTAKFGQGQEKHAVETLGDLGEGVNPLTWEPLFKGNKIHAVWIVTGDSQMSVDHKIEEIVRKFHGSFIELGREYGKVRKAGDGRENPLEHREHFGFEDGISFSRIKEFHHQDQINDNHPGIKASQFLLGLEKPESGESPPKWAKAASYLAFRKLEQHVPEFDKFTKFQAEKEPQMTPEQVGARMVGRWKNGTPLDLNAKDNHLENAKDIDEFRFVGDDMQDKCPFAAHIRKMNPRQAPPPLDNRAEFIDKRLILRHGIPYGEELHPDEEAFGKTLQDRGLLFVCYQANIIEQFAFLQQSWANNEEFPPVKAFDGGFKAGFDPIIGQKSKAQDRKTFSMQGLVAQKVTGNNDNRTPLIPWVVPKGGEYFISPSISALENKFFIEPKKLGAPTGGQSQQKPFDLESTK